MYSKLNLLLPNVLSIKLEIPKITFDNIYIFELNTNSIWLSTIGID